MICPNCESPDVTRERRPNGYTRCNACRLELAHQAWDQRVKDEGYEDYTQPEPIKLAPVEPIGESSAPPDIAPLRPLLAKSVYERLEALCELYGVQGAPMLSMLITDAYMDRVAAFREAEED